MIKKFSEYDGFDTIYIFSNDEEEIFLNLENDTKIKIDEYYIGDSFPPPHHIENNNNDNVFSFEMTEGNGLLDVNGWGGVFFTSLEDALSKYEEVKEKRDLSELDLVILKIDIIEIKTFFANKKKAEEYNMYYTKHYIE